jgi:hypothetical protein
VLVVAETLKKVTLRENLIGLTAFLGSFTLLLEASSLGIHPKSDFFLTFFDFFLGFRVNEKE